MGTYPGHRNFTKKRSIETNGLNNMVLLVCNKVIHHKPLISSAVFYFVNLKIISRW